MPLRPQARVLPARALDQLAGNQANAPHADDGQALDQLAAHDGRAHHLEAPPEPQALVSARRRGLLGFVVDVVAGLLPRKARAWRPPLRLVPAPQRTNADVIEGVIVPDPPAASTERSILDDMTWSHER